eukprot:2539922-Prymnesium_polylepis.1
MPYRCLSVSFSFRPFVDPRERQDAIPRMISTQCGCSLTLPFFSARIKSWMYEGIRDISETWSSANA